jgi:hypothetical protein
LTDDLCNQSFLSYAQARRAPQGPPKVAHPQPVI